MRKAKSLAMLTLSLIALLHISVATHYCGGIEVASVVSLNGRLAECGMENGEKPANTAGLVLSHHCCDNMITYCGIHSIFSSSASPDINLLQLHYQDFIIPAKISYTDLVLTNHYNPDTSPPWDLRSTEVDLSDICIFRI